MPAAGSLETALSPCRFSYRFQMRDVTGRGEGGEGEGRVRREILGFRLVEAVSLVLCISNARAVKIAIDSIDAPKSR